MAIDESEVRQVACQEIRNLCDAVGINAEDYRITVIQSAAQPRLWLVLWNVIKPNKDGRVLSRSTGVDISENADVLRRRLRRIFAEEPEDLEGMYTPQGVNIQDVG